MSETLGVWDAISLGLGLGSSAAAVAAAVWGVWTLARRKWENTIGKRKAQTRILDQLACTVSMAFVENVIGPPRFILGNDPSSEERFYRLPGCWVGIVPRGNAVERLSITITDRQMWYRTDGLTLGTIDVRLGVDTFAKASEHFDGEELWVATKQRGYNRHYHFGGAGGAHQQFWLAFNAVGAGSIALSEPYSSGVFGDFGDSPPNSADTTVNTLAVLSPLAALGDHGHGPIGPHIENVGLLDWAERRAVRGSAARRRTLTERLRVRRARQ